MRKYTVSGGSFVAGLFLVVAVVRRAVMLVCAIVRDMIILLIICKMP